MTVMLAFGNCYTCGRFFSFNPVKVPSLPASVTQTGEKEPVCLDCVTRANPERKARGLVEIVPLPDAYDGEEVP